MARYDDALPVEAPPAGASALLPCGFPRTSLMATPRGSLTLWPESQRTASGWRVQLASLPDLQPQWMTSYMERDSPVLARVLGAPKQAFASQLSSPRLLGSNALAAPAVLHSSAPLLLGAETLNLKNLSKYPSHLLKASLERTRLCHPPF
ncbi:hypothetical protein HispidOSU_008387 [Sigmodon hispidus]